MKFMAFLSFLWDTYLTSNEGLATLFVVLALVLKLLINRKVTKLHFKKMMVSIPSEITFLVIGFLLSAMISQMNTDRIRTVMAMLVIALIIIVVEYAMERYLDDKLSGTMQRKIIIYIIGMFSLSFILYYFVVFRR